MTYDPSLWPGDWRSKTGDRLFRNLSFAVGLHSHRFPFGRTPDYGASRFKMSMKNMFTKDNVAYWLMHIIIALFLSSMLLFLISLVTMAPAVGDGGNYAAFPWRCAHGGPMPCDGAVVLPWSSGLPFFVILLGIQVTVFPMKRDIKE